MSLNNSELVRKLTIVFLFLFVLLGCGREPTAVSSTKTPLPAQPTATELTAVETATAVPTVAATATATVVPSPLPSATPASLKIGAATGVPDELIQAFQTVADITSTPFVWAEDDADVTLMIDGDTAVTEMVLAVAVPFGTIQDEVTLAELQAEWQAGALILTAEMADLLTSWWGEPDNPNTVVADDALVAALWEGQTDLDTAVKTILPFDTLEPRLKVLSVEGQAPVDMDFEQATYALTVPFGLVGAEADVAAVLTVLEMPQSNRDDGRVTHVIMTGPAGMRRAVADRMEKYGIHYPAEVTGPILQMADIAHMSDEDPFAPNCPLPDPNDSTNVCNREEYFELMLWMGIDVAEATGNHLNDWGTWAMDFTLDLYDEHGIQYFGGGRNLTDAAEPVLIEHNGNQIAFVGCNPTGPEFSWATETEPGTQPCGDYSQLKAQITQLAAEGYLVISTLQYLEDYQYMVLDQQRQVFQSLAEAGATAVSGSHGHHPQGFSFYNDAFIHYGLGNLLADQMWSLGTRQTFLDIYTFYDGRLLNVTLWTGLNEDYGRIREMTAEERQDLLQAVFAESDW